MAAPSLEPFTKQPLYYVLKDRRLPFTAVAAAIDVPVPSLRASAYGYIYPSARMKQELPKYLTLALTDLFEDRVLEGPSTWQGRAYREDPEAGRATEDDRRRELERNEHSRSYQRARRGVVIAR